MIKNHISWGTGTVFIGRKEELDSLERAYGSSGNRCCAIYGRRRIGKTSLVSEFVKGKESLFFYATDKGEEANLELFRAVMDEAGHGTEDVRDMPSFFGVLSRIMEERSGIVVVIDEFPDLVKSSPTAMTSTQMLIDLHLKGTRSFLVVLGSSVSAMKTEVLGKDKPLFGRFGRVMEIGPLSVRECREMVPGMPLEDAMDLYCILGGVPAYYEALTGKTFRECLTRDILAPNTMFGNEAEFIVLRELTPYDTYSSILGAVASGCVTSGLIQGRTGLDQSTCSRCLTNLLLVGFVEKDVPMLGTDRRTDRYRISDRFLDWHFSIAERYSRLIESMGPDSASERLDPEIRTFMGRGFEAACRDYVKHACVCSDIGRWWGRVDGEDVDIDIVAVIEEDGASKVLLAECKYRRRRTSYGAFAALKERGMHVRTRLTPVYAVFSRSGFSDDLKEAEEDGLVTLVGLDGIYGVDASPPGSSHRPSLRSRCGRGACALQRCRAPASASGPPGPATAGRRRSRACTCPGPLGA